MTATIQCVLCGEAFNRKKMTNYCLETMVCGNCYAGMQAQPASQCCFGKPTVMDGPRGYDPDARECNELCPDRKVCYAVLMGEQL